MHALPHPGDSRREFLVMRMHRTHAPAPCAAQAVLDQLPLDLRHQAAAVEGVDAELKATAPTW